MANREKIQITRCFSTDTDLFDERDVPTGRCYT
jgi:hypothetical protein